MDVNPTALDQVDQEALGKRLAVARKARGFTQAAAAELLGLARTTLTAIETGVRRPRAVELVRLAELYEQSVGDILAASSDSAQPSFETLFRAAGDIGGDEGDATIAKDIQRFEQLCRWYGELERMLEAPLPRRYPPVYRSEGPSIDQSAEAIASSERNRLGLGDGPIGDLYALLEADIGLRIFAIDVATPQVAGMFQVRADLGGCIAVNANHPEARRRWTLAHEYSHFLIDRNRGEISILRSSRKIPPQERLADAFAKHFLMPGVGLGRRFDEIWRAVGGRVSPAEVLQLAHIYRVSFESMMTRLEELERLPRGTYRRLKAEGFRPHEAKRHVSLSSSDPDPVLPLRYELLAVFAYERGLLTEGQLAERLGFPKDRVSTRMRVDQLLLQHRVEDGELMDYGVNLTQPLLLAGD